MPGMRKGFSPRHRLISGLGIPGSRRCESEGCSEGRPVPQSVDSHDELLVRRIQAPDTSTHGCWEE